MRPRHLVVLAAVVAGLVLFVVGQSAIAVAVLAAGALVLVLGSGSRYDRRPATGGAAGVSTPKEMWDSLDAGDDPTDAPVDAPAPDADTDDETGPR